MKYDGLTLASVAETLCRANHGKGENSLDSLWLHSRDSQAQGRVFCPCRYFPIFFSSEHANRFNIRTAQFIAVTGKTS